MLNKAVVQDILSIALETGADFSEVFAEDRMTSQITLQSGKVDSNLSGRDFGVGIRVFKGLKSAYAYTTDASKESLIRTAKQAAKAVSGERIIQAKSLAEEKLVALHPVLQLPQNVETIKKINVMRKANEISQNYHERIRQTLVRYLDEEQNVLIANSEGKFVEDRRVRCRLLIQAIASDGKQIQTGYYGPGAFKGFEFMENLNLEHYAGEAARIAVTMLGAKPCPSGKFPVIIDNEFGGVIFHEACGHGLEAAAVAKNNSVFANRIGEKVASDVVTYIDDGTLKNEWGSITVDDEGEKTRKNILIENGILKGYLIDKFNGRRMGMSSTGSGRRQSYRYAPTSRMTNTYIAPGKSTTKEIIANTEHGIYTKYMGGGQVNPATGDYNFAVMEAYIVKNGQITEPVRGATLIGNGPKTLQLVDMVGDNLAHGAGMCGASSGSIPVNVGQPMIRVSEMTVGGRKEEE
ncbi:TldD/PmbA family protein [Bacillaceae bacterium Marseille-Q3522]|nr:TldD/PmbA family protein [Bacillaceae bacterium Marseille-Q3522]